MKLRKLRQLHPVWSCAKRTPKQNQKSGQRLQATTPQKETDNTAQSIVRTNENPICPFALRFIFLFLATLTCQSASVTATSAIATPLPDPSLITVMEDGTAVERYRFVADINQDGSPDLILSENVRWLGTGGGIFTVYLNENGNYRPIGTIGGNPLAIALEHFEGSHKIWFYWRNGYKGGEVGYYEILDGKLQDAKSIEIHPSDSGTDLGRKIYRTIFAEPFLLSPEISTTSDNGVTWKPFRP